MRAPRIFVTGCAIALIAAIPTQAGAATGGSNGTSPGPNGSVTNPVQGYAYPAPTQGSDTNGPVTNPVQGYAYPAPTQGSGTNGPVTKPVQGNAYTAPIHRPMPPTGRQLLPTGLPAPTHLLAHNDPQSCAAYGGFAGGLACAALLPKGGLAFMWQYGANHIDGFRLYAVPNPWKSGNGGSGNFALLSTSRLAGPNTPVATQTDRLTDGTVARLVVLDPRPHGFEGDCFAATAYVGSTESAMTLPFCVGSNATAKSVSLAPIHSLTVKNELFFDADAGGPAPCCDTESNDPDPFKYGAVLFVGHYRWHYLTTGNNINAGVQRAALLYDVSSLKGSKIYKAVLHFTREYATGFSCITEIDPAPSGWWTKAPGYLPPLSPQMSTQQYAGQTFDIDITPIVSGWTSGQPNNGLTLRGDSWPNVVYQLKNISDTCSTPLLNVTLDVIYF